MVCLGGAWMAQSVECQAPDFGPGHDPRVMGLSPASGSALRAWSLLGILSPSLCPSATHTHALSLSLSLSKWVNKLKKNKNKKMSASSCKLLACHNMADTASCRSRLLYPLGVLSVTTEHHVVGEQG